MNNKGLRMKNLLFSQKYVEVSIKQKLVNIVVPVANLTTISKVC
jgi:hypothetical protein